MGWHFFDSNNNNKETDSTHFLFVSKRAAITINQTIKQSNNQQQLKMAKSVKGNRKGWIRSYQLQRFLVIATISAVGLFFCAVLSTELLGYGSRGSNNNVRRSLLFSHAAEIQVSTTGQVVDEVRFKNKNILFREKSLSPCLCNRTY